MNSALPFATLRSLLIHSLPRLTVRSAVQPRDACHHRARAPIALSTRPHRPPKKYHPQRKKRNLPRASSAAEPYAAASTLLPPPPTVRRRNAAPPAPSACRPARPGLAGRRCALPRCCRRAAPFLPLCSAMTAVSASLLRCSEQGRLSFSRSPSLNSLSLLRGSALLSPLPCSEQGHLDGCVRAQVGEKTTTLLIVCAGLYAYRLQRCLTLRPPKIQVFLVDNSQSWPRRVSVFSDPTSLVAQILLPKLF